MNILIFLYWVLYVVVAFLLNTRCSGHRRAEKSQLVI